MTGLVEIPASWYLDDLPPMMFIKKVRRKSLYPRSSLRIF